MSADKKSYTLRMPVVLLSRIDTYAKKNGMTQAQVLIQACRDYLDPITPYMAPSTTAGKIGPKTGEPELTSAGLEAAGVEPAPVCPACEGSTVEGHGKFAGRWECSDVGCPRFGLEVKR